MLDNIELVATRLWASGITNIEFNKENESDNSLRSNIEKYLNINNYLTKNDFNLIDFNFEFFSNYKLFTKSKYCKDILYNFSYRRVEHIRNYSSILDKRIRKKENQTLYSRFYIFDLLNILKILTLILNKREVIGVLKYIKDGSYWNNEFLYELIKNNNYLVKPCLVILINYIKSNEVNQERLNKICLNFAEVLYFVSLNYDIDYEINKNLINDAILLLECLNSKVNNEEVFSKFFQKYLLMESDLKTSFSHEKINSILNDFSEQDTFSLAVMRILSNKYIEYIKNKNIKSIHPSLCKSDPFTHSYNLVRVICYKLGIHPQSLYYKNTQSIEGIDSILNDLHIFLNLGFNSIHLLLLMRHELNWKQLNERTAGFNKLNKSLFLLHCLDKPDLNPTNNDLYTDYNPDESKYGQSIHFSIQILLTKFSNKGLDNKLKDEINNHINSLCPDRDLQAYSYAYFLSKSINHKSADEIHHRCEVNNSLYYKVNSFLNYLFNLSH